MKDTLAQDKLLYTVEHPRAATPCVLRPLLLRPRNFSFRLVPYQEAAEIVAACRANASSAAKVRFLSSTRSAREARGMESSHSGLRSPAQQPKRWLAVQLRMHLPANAYATMLLRELLRSPASSAAASTSGHAVENAQGGMVAQYRRRQQAEAEEVAAQGGGKAVGAASGGGGGLRLSAERARRRTLRRMKRRHFVEDWRVGLADRTAAWRLQNPRAR